MKHMCASASAQPYPTLRCVRLCICFIPCVGLVTEFACFILLLTRSPHTKRTAERSTRITWRAILGCAVVIHTTEFPCVNSLAYSSAKCCACMWMRATLDLFTELWIYQSSATASLSFICIPKIPNGIRLLLQPFLRFDFHGTRFFPESSKWYSYFWLFYFNFDLFSPIFNSIFSRPTIFLSLSLFSAKRKRKTAKGKNTIIIIISEALTARPIVVRRKKSEPLKSRSRSVSHKYDFLTRNPQIEYIIIIRVRQKPAKQIMLRFMWCGGNGFGYTTCG